MVFVATRIRSSKTLLNLLSFTLGLYSFLLQAQPASAATLQVPQQYSTIQAAINAADANDVVLVTPGTYPGGIIINKTITLASLFHTTGDKKYISQTILSGGEAVVAIDSPAGPNTTIVGLTIQGGEDGIIPTVPFKLLHSVIRDNVDGIDYEDGGGIAADNVFEENSDDGIDLDGDVAVIIERNIVRNNGQDGIEMRMQHYSGNKVLEVIIRNNTIVGNEGDGMQLISYDELTNRSIRFERNLVLNNQQAGIGMMDNEETDEDYRAASIPEPFFIYNNTFVGQTHAISGGNNVLALNNIFSGATTLALKNLDGNSIVAHSLFWNNAANNIGSNLVANSWVNANPLLTAEHALSANSPAIDTGVAQYS